MTLEELEEIQAENAKLHAALAAVYAVVDDLAERGKQIEEKFERNGNGSILSNRHAGRGAGYREADYLIREAISNALGADNA